MNRDYKFHGYLYLVSKLIFFIIIITIISYIFHSFSFSNNTENLRSIQHSSSNITNNVSSNLVPPSLPSKCKRKFRGKTQLHHLVFAIASSSKVWKRRQNYVKLWYRPDKMRGYVWLDEPVKNQSWDRGLPKMKISSNTSEFREQYNNDESAVRIARVVSETFRLGWKNEDDEDDVRWFVMGDDDTFVITDNLIRVLRKYDHNQFYYIGGSSETHLQNIIFGYNTAFGGGGFAISYPLAKAFEGMQDTCMKRYNKLYTSDHRIQACMAELGVPLTREVGFHQFDVLGNVFGILAAHPVAPLISLHHLDLVNPMYPNVTQLGSLRNIKAAMALDSAALAQQSICYDTARNWTVSVSWGYTVQIHRGISSARMMERPPRTFFNWYRTNDPIEFSFNTRPFNKNACQRPFVHMFSYGSFNASNNITSSTYVKFPSTKTRCKWRTPDPDQIVKVEVYKLRDPNFWENKAPRRNCCRVLQSEQNNVLALDVGKCRPGEIVERNSA